MSDVGYARNTRNHSDGGEGEVECAVKVEVVSSKVWARLAYSRGKSQKEEEADRSFQGHTYTQLTSNP